MRTIMLAASLLAAPCAWASGMYDGTYHGQFKPDPDKENAQICSKGAPIQITVTDNQLSYNHMGNATITATVNADGSFSGSGTNKFSGGRSTPQVQQLAGKIQGGAILAKTDVANRCFYVLTAKKFG
jgi:hypothetical protein